MTPDVMRACECAVYEYLLADYGTEARFITSVLTGVNELHTRAGVHARVRGRRMSGDMCTSVGNGLTNLLLILFIVSEKGGEVHGFVEGDDGLFATDVPLSTGDYLRCGFSVEIHQVRDPSLAHFCGMTFTAPGQIIKDPRRVFQSFGWTSSFINAGTLVMESLLRSKALSLAYEVPNCPILGVLARKALELTDGVNLSHVEEKWGYDVRSLPTTVPPFCPTLATRELMSEVFGITTETQLLVEGHIRAGRLDLVSSLIPPVTDMLKYSARYIEVG